jgi:hypothetical protein
MLAHLVTGSRPSYSPRRTIFGVLPEIMATKARLPPQDSIASGKHPHRPAPSISERETLRRCACADTRRVRFRAIVLPRFRVEWHTPWRWRFRHDTSHALRGAREEAGKGPVTLSTDCVPPWLLDASHCDAEAALSRPERESWGCTAVSPGCATCGLPADARLIRRASAVAGWVACWPRKFPVSTLLMILIPSCHSVSFFGFASGYFSAKLCFRIRRESRASCATCRPSNSAAVMLISWSRICASSIA